VIDDLGTLVRETITFGKTVGISVAHLDDHRKTLEDVKRLLEDLTEQQKKANDLKAVEEKRLNRAGDNQHEFRMRLLHGAGGLLTGSIVPAMLWYFLGYEPATSNCPPPAAPAEVQDASP
jgi:uncharacterized protein YgbK (DUF1537 family)